MQVLSSERQQVIEWLKKNGYPALPVAPAQDPSKYPKRNKQGEIEYSKDGVTPLALFTGKNPSYLDKNGNPHLVNHREFQKRLPSAGEISQWFANPENGIGTLGGWNNTVWLDFDVKQFSSQQECDADIFKILEHPKLRQTFIERSHSGGWRVGIRVQHKPKFTNFTLAPGGKHIGEALGEGRFTVLAPTIGVSGNPYQSINRTLPVEVESLESIGIYPTSNKNTLPVESRLIPQHISYIPGSIPLEKMGNDTSGDILQGHCPTGDRSEALATALQEWYGWQNWAKENDISIIGTPEDLAHYAGSKLGIDSDRVNRIIKTIDIISSNPAALHRGGEESCWKKIYRLDKAAFEAKCPAHIKDGIKRDFSNKSASFSAIKKPDSHLPKNASVTDDSQLSRDSHNRGIISIAATVTIVTDILEKGYPEWIEISQLESVRINSELSNKQAFSALVKKIKNQFDEVQPEDEMRLRALIDWHNAELDFHKAIPSMAGDILHDAQVLNIDPIGIWQYLLPAVLSLVGKRVNLDVGSHEIPAIAWTVLIAESGTGKTRAEKLVTHPLKQLQKQARERYQAEVAEWEETIANWEKGNGKKPPKPTEKKWLFDVATIQAIMRRLSEQGLGGSLWARDELAGLFQSLNQFNKGESEALSCLIASWDGGSGSVDRVNQEDSYFIDAIRLCIAGGLQPGIFKKVFKDPSDSQGLQARFLFAAMKPKMPKRTKGSCHLSERLPLMYQWISTLPEGQIKLSTEAERYYDKLYEAIGAQAFHTSMPAIRAWMFKLPAQLLRIALGLHLIECYHDQSRPLWVLQKDTLERAVLFAQYYRSTFHTVQTTAADTDDISSILLQIWDKAITRHPEGISTRDAYREIKAIQFRAKDAGRPVSAYTADLFTKLQEMGKGVVTQNGRQIKFVAHLITPPLPPIDGENPQDDPPRGDQETVTPNAVTTEAVGVIENELSPVTVELNDSSIANEQYNVVTEPCVEDCYLTEVAVEQPVSSVEDVPRNAEVLANEETPTTSFNASTTLGIEPECSGRFNNAPQDVCEQAASSVADEPTDISAELLASLICDAQNWEEVEMIMAAAPGLRQRVWALLTDEHKNLIREMKQAVSESTEADGSIQVGDRVFVDNCPHTDKFAPFEVLEVDGEFARIEMFLKPVRVSDLRKAK